MDFETNGMTIVQRIDKIRKQKNISREDITSSCKISKSSFPTWSARGTIPPADVAIKIAWYLGVSVEWLITGHDPEGLTEDDRKILDMYHLLDERDREDVLGIIEGKLERSTLRQEAGTEKSGLVG